MPVVKEQRQRAEFHNNDSLALFSKKVIGNFDFKS